jgi:amidase
MALGINAPSSDDLREIARGIGWEPEPDELEAYTAYIEAVAAALDRLDEYESLEARPPRPADRSAGWAPSDDEDPLGAWAWRADIAGEESGPLFGKRVVVKDNMAVAGLPLRNGTTFIDDLIPDFDATVVTRVLSAGGRIAGKAACAALSVDGLGITGGRRGPVRNPYDQSRTFGGSSSGCGALVGARIVEMAIGAQQGGSILIPAAMCGIYGMKPAWGLVPYTGAYAQNPQIDTLGPMTATVAELEALLRVIAGPDGWDPRQQAKLMLSQPLITRVDELRVGVLREGFGWAQSEPDVDAAVEEAAAALGRLGAKVVDVSVPGHRGRLLAGLEIEIGHYNYDEFGTGGPFLGFVDPAMVTSLNRWRSRPQELPLWAKLTLLTARALRDQSAGRAFAHSQNHALALCAAYGDVLGTVDVMVCPTIPMKAMPIPQRDLPTSELVDLLVSVPANTRQFNRTGYPALSIPCALSDGLPVGMQLIGRKGEDLLLVEVARWFEENIFPAPTPPSKHKG